jgi:hypothetical protein
VASTTPNKEIVRRICHLHGATKCILLVDTGDVFVEIMTNISTDKIASCTTELEQWAGMKFRVYNFSEDNNMTSKIVSQGESILPIKL